MKPSRFCHVVLKTGRFEEMIDWYQKVLDCRVQTEGSGIAFMTYDEEHHRVALVDIGPTDAFNGSRGPNTVGVAHFAYAWDDIGQLLTTYKKAKAHGVLPMRQTRHGVTLSLYYDDPDGNNMEFQVDLMDVEAANEYMATDSFRANPRGEVFDVEELIARFDSGESVDDLIFRSDQPQRLGKSITKANPIVSFDGVRKTQQQSGSASGKLPTEHFNTDVTTDDKRFPALDVESMSPLQISVASELIASGRKSLKGPFHCWLRSPEAAQRLGKLGEYLRFGSNLGRDLIELATLLTARAWDSEYEWQAHRPAALAGGVSEAVIDAIAEGRTPEGMTPRQAAAYHLCVQLRRDREVTDEVFQTAVDLIGEEGIVDLIAISGLYDIVAMTLIAARIPLPESKAPSLPQLQTEAV